VTEIVRLKSGRLVRARIVQRSLSGRSVVRALWAGLEVVGWPVPPHEVPMIEKRGEADG